MFKSATSDQDDPLYISVFATQLSPGTPVSPPVTPASEVVPKPPKPSPLAVLRFAELPHVPLGIPAAFP